MYSRIQRVIEDFDLQKYVEETFDNIQYAANGDELRINCFAPSGCARSDNKHKLYVNPTKKQWICFKCGYGTKQQEGTSSLIRFIADAEGIPPLLVRHKLSKLVNPTPQEELEDLLKTMFDPVPTPVFEPRTISLDKEFYPLTTKVGSQGKAALRYVEDRGLTGGELLRYDVRYRPVGAAGSQDIKQWAGRVVFPIYDRQGILRSASGRLFSQPAVKLTHERPRWWHWPNTDIDKLLWPLYPGKPFEEFGSQIVLTEGIFDALTVNQLSDKQALCTFGHKISAGQIQILKDIGTKSVILAWDYDSKKAMESAAKNLEMHGMQTKVFPFSHNDYWKNYDLGAMITSGMSWPIDKMQEMLLNELANPISCYDTKFLEWWMS